MPRNDFTVKTWPCCESLCFLCCAHLRDFRGNCERYKTKNVLETTVNWKRVYNRGYNLRNFLIQSNLGSRTPRIMNNSVYEQIFRTQSVSDDVLCLELRTCKQSRVVPRERRKKKIPLPNNNISLPHHLPLTPSTLLLTTFHLRRQLSSSPPSTYAVNSPPYRYSKTKLSFRLYLFRLVLCLSFLW